MGQKKKLKTSDKPNKKMKLSSEKSSSKKLESQSLDEFLAGWGDEDESDVEEETQKPSEESLSNGKAKENKVKKKKKEKKKSNKEDKVKSKKSETKEIETKEDSSEEEAPQNSSGAKSQKKYINSLKDKDPEFYKFLKEEDSELLNFDESSEDEEKDEEDAEGAIHELPDKLEVASDESDYEDDEEDEGEKGGKVAKSGKITKEMVDSWASELQQNPNKGFLSTVIEAFRAAVITVGSGEAEEQPCKFRVDGPTIFNAIIRMCVMNLCPAIKKFLRQGEDKDDVQKPQRSKKWKRIEKNMRIYLDQLCVLISRIAEPSVAVVLLKHTHQMIPYFQTHPKGEKQLLGRMIKCWSQGEETVRVLALMCIIRIVRNSHNLLEPALKQMYMSYVKNTKFTSPTTLPLINFMRRSLVEIYGLDHKLAYYQGFIQIRQLAIHLRNAIVHSKKETLQAVYNWQFVHSLELWGALLGHTRDSEILQPLIYPLVQVTLGVVRLNPSSKYFPLRFHCANVLSSLATQTQTFIPVLPIYLDILHTYNFTKKSKKASMKPLEFACILKVSKSQQGESGFKDTIVEEVYAGLVTYLANNSNKIGFPELVTPLVFELKDFLKNCKVGNYCKKIKQILDKVISNMKFIENRRKAVTFGVGDAQNIEIWEAQVERDGTPLMAFYKSWKKVAETNKMKRLTQSINMDDISHIPLLKKNHKKIRMKTEQEPEASGFLSGSDDDDEMDDEERFKLKEERGKKKKVQKDDQDDDESDDNDEEEDNDDDSNDDDAEDDSNDDHAEQNGNDESDDGDEDDAEDQVTDLRLEDMEDSDDEVELKDDYGAEEDSGDDVDDSGDESDD